MNMKKSKQGYRTRLYLKLMLNKLKVKGRGFIPSWGSKKRKQNSMIFVALFFANSIYLKQI